MRVSHHQETRLGTSHHAKPFPLFCYCWCNTIWLLFHMIWFTRTVDYCVYTEDYNRVYGFKRKLIHFTADSKLHSTQDTEEIHLNKNYQRWYSKNIQRFLRTTNFIWNIISFKKVYLKTGFRICNRSFVKLYIYVCCWLSWSYKAQCTELQHMQHAVNMSKVCMHVHTLTCKCFCLTGHVK